MSTNLWRRFQDYFCSVPTLGMTLDISRMRFEDGFLDQMAGPMQRAFEAMDALERGAIANPDEKRMVGHYWLRTPELAPSPAIATDIRNTVAEIKQFAAAVHDGTCWRSASAVRPSARCLWPMPWVTPHTTA